MKYRLINKQTKEEHLCDKVTIDGFDYYVSDDFKVGDKVKLKSDINVGQVVDDLNKDWSSYWFNPIATNNPNIDIPKVVDEVRRFAEEFSRIYSQYYYQQQDFENGIIQGYNKSQETHPYSEDFFDWIDKEEIPREEGKWIKYFNGKDNYLTTKELLQIWKDQRIKTIYYE